jgi:hypothetical protein
MTKSSTLYIEFLFRSTIIRRRRHHYYYYNKRIAAEKKVNGKNQIRVMNTVYIPILCNDTMMMIE